MESAEQSGQDPSCREPSSCSRGALRHQTRGFISFFCGGGGSATQNLLKFSFNFLDAVHVSFVFHFWNEISFFENLTLIAILLLLLLIVSA